MTDEVERLCDIDSGLTQWEVGFVEDIARRVLDQHLPLTDAQRAKAEHILGDRE